MVFKLFTEFANTRKSEIERLHNLADIIKTHMMCIYYWRNESCLKHWESEVFGLLPTMKKLKGLNRFLSENLIYENLFLDWYETFHNDIRIDVKKLMYKESNLPKIKNIDEYNICGFMEDFYKVICHELATKGNVDDMLVYNVINKLLKKYPYKI